MSRNNKVEVIHHKRGADVVTVVLPGFNQDGQALTPILEPSLNGSDVLTYKLPRWGFDQQLLVRSLSAVADYAKVIVYAESAGALDLATLLRTYPGLRVSHLVLNAGMGSVQDTNAGSWLHLSRIIPGWALPTRVLRYNQRKTVANSPALVQGTNAAAARRAENNSINLTGRQVVGEFRRMATTRPIELDEFASRVGVLTYMGAPNQSGPGLAEHDPLVKLRQAARRWNSATGLRATLIAPASWKGLHTPTPEKPGPVMRALRAAIATELG